jgi:hypothetical protein
LGYSNIKIAKSFWVFGISIFIGTVTGYAGAFLIMPWFYALQNEDKMLPEITINFHPSILFYFVVLPTVCFSALSVYYAWYKFKKPVLLLLKDNMQTASKTPNHRIEKSSELSFVEYLKRNTLKSKKALVFFIIFASFCFSAMTQMSFSMKDLSSERVYIIFTLTTIRQAMNCAEKSAIKYLTELEEFGLIERIRQGFGKPALIYVKNFIDQQNLQVKTSKNYSSPPVKVTGQDLYNLQPNYTYNNNTDFNNTNPILSEDEDRMGYEKYFMEQLNIEALKQDYPYDREMIDGIMDLILDVVCSKRKIICIAGDVKSVNVVKGRFMKLNMEHIRYVMNCMQENTTKIRSIKQYMLAALYNAPATIDSYYRAEVNHDMAEGKI